MHWPSLSLISVFGLKSVVFGTRLVASTCFSCNAGGFFTTELPGLPNLWTLPFWHQWVRTLGDIYPSLVPQIWFSVHFCNGISSVSLAGLVCLPSWPCLSPPTLSGPSSAFSWELSLLRWQVASDHPTATCPSSICLLSLSHCVNFSGQSHLNSERLTPPGLKTLTFVSKNCFLSFGQYSHQSWSPTDLSFCSFPFNSI